jgi:hypothetical protein
VWNAFSKYTDGSIQWIPKQISVEIGEDFHSQVGDGKIKESHTKDGEKLAFDHQCQEAKTVTDDLVNTPKHTLLSMVGLTSAVWTLDMFQVVVTCFRWL